MLRAFLLLVCAWSAALADTARTLQLLPAGDRVLVDGVIDVAWAAADSATGFFQMQPYFNQPPSRPTVAKVLTSPDALYCLMICFDDRRNIQANAGVHDQGSGDIVSLMLDTFGDRQSAYKFAVTAAGVRADCRLLDDARNRDYSWDGVWFAASEVYDWGFVVEMEIPYTSIKYDPSLDEWGLDFDRWIPANMEDLYWAPYQQEEGQRISRFGRLRLNGFTPAADGLNVELYPVAFSRASLLGGTQNDASLNGGLDVFYNPSEKLTYQLTVNPDFAQIEADPFSFNISRYETYFSEQRPFFTEGNEIFMASGRERNSGFYRPMELFYSRRIGKILPDGAEVPLTFGTKAVGRLGDWEYGGFVALTGEREYEDDGERLTEPRARFASVRLKRTVLENSTLGGLFVGKHTREGSDGVLDIDGAVRSSNLQIPFQIARSFRNGRGDFAGSVGIGTSSRTWIHRVRLRAVGKEFDVSQVGYVPWQGTVEAVGLSGPQ